MENRCRVDSRRNRPAGKRARAGLAMRSAAEAGGETTGCNGGSRGGMFLQGWRCRRPAVWTGAPRSADIPASNARLQIRLVGLVQSSVWETKRNERKEWPRKCMKGTKGAFDFSGAFRSFDPNLQPG